MMNSDIAAIAKWARANGYRVEDDSKGYTRFYAPDGSYVANYPATPSNPRRRVADLTVKLRASGLEWPAPSKSEQRARRRRSR